MITAIGDNCSEAKPAGQPMLEVILAGSLS